jgi:hypothetical protein
MRKTIFLIFSYTIFSGFFYVFGINFALFLSQKYFVCLRGRLPRPQVILAVKMVMDGDDDEKRP